jgi:hypothetical protein
MSFATADLCDAHEDQLALGTLRVLEPVFHLFSRAECFSGEAVTLRVFEDNALVRATLEEKGDGRVLVVDGGGSLRCALVGGNLAQIAEQNGWAGIVLNRWSSMKSMSAWRRWRPARGAVRSSARASATCRCNCRARWCVRANGSMRTSTACWWRARR